MVSNRGRFLFRGLDMLRLERFKRVLSMVMKAVVMGGIKYIALVACGCVTVCGLKIIASYLFRPVREG